MNICNACGKAKQTKPLTWGQYSSETWQMGDLCKDCAKLLDAFIVSLLQKTANADDFRKVYEARQREKRNQIFLIIFLTLVITGFIALMIIGGLTS